MMKPSEYRKGYLSKLGNEIRRLRIERGLSQDDLAQICGYKSRSSITKIERGGYDLPLPKLKTLAEALGVPPMYFLGIDVDQDETEDLPEDELALLELYRRLNSSGREKATDYLSDLAGMEKYTKKEKTSRGSA